MTRKLLLAVEFLVMLPSLYKIICCSEHLSWDPKSSAHNRALPRPHIRADNLTSFLKCCPGTCMSGPPPWLGWYLAGWWTTLGCMMPWGQPVLPHQHSLAVHCLHWPSTLWMCLGMADSSLAWGLPPTRSKEESSQYVSWLAWPNCICMLTSLHD